MKLQAFAVGTIGSNCYVLTDEETGSACVIDCGECTKEILDALKGFDLKYILLTHGHFDHIMGVPELKKRFPHAKVCIHRLDEICLRDRKSSLMHDFPLKTEDISADILFSDGDVIEFGSHKITVMHTPGHSVGSVCYIDYDAGAVYSGDTLFCLTYGRTDFPGGSDEEMEKSLKKLLTLDDSFKVYPGHNRSTSIGFERRNNRAFRHFL